MSTSFSVPCPSCEAKVVIKNPNLIGTKVECPKCKYRFKVEAPKDEAAAAEAKPKAEAKKPAKSKKKLVGAVLGVLAVVLLVIVGASIFGGGDEKKPTPNPNPNPRPVALNPNPNPNTNPGGTATPVDPANPDKDKKDKEKPKDPPVKRVASAPPSDKDATNLLPGQSVAVYRFDFERLRQSHLGQTLLDRSMTDLFRVSMGFDASNVDKYIHCIVGEKERAPFGVICLKEPLFEKEIAIAGASPTRSIGKNLNLLVVKGNPFLTAIGHSLAARSLFAESHAPPPPDAAAKGKPLGACIYDTQHIMVGEYEALEKFLSNLKDGYPEFKTVWQKPAAPPPKKDAKDGKDGKAGPTATPPMPMTVPMPKGTTVPTAPSPAVPGKEPAKEAPKAKPPAAVADKDFTTNPSYLSISGDLKKLLNTLESDPEGTGSPAIIMAEKFNYGAYVPQKLTTDILPLLKVIDPVLSRTAYIGLNLGEFTPRHCELTLLLVGKSGDDAKFIAIDELTPALTEKIPLLASLLDMNLKLRNYADPNAIIPDSEIPGGVAPFPGTPMPGSPGKSNYPGAKSPGGPQFSGPMGRPMSPSSPGPMGRPMYPSSPGPMGRPMYPSGPMGRPMSPSTPGPMGRPMYPSGPSFPGSPSGYPGGPDEPPPPPPSTPSYIDLHLTDRTVSISASIYWTDKAFNDLVQPRLFGFANELKGKTMVYSGNRTWTGLAQAVVKYVEHNKKFPPGTIPRPPANQLRFGLDYPPIQRLSLFVELLPYLGRGNVHMKADESWFDKNNLEAASTWVPEFLVFYYDQSAWRAHTPIKPGMAFGGTNYVAIAGVGPDAARFNAANPAEQKLMGISGYDWGSKVEEVTDGLANTIFLMQVPARHPRPWAAGGGATVLGLNPANPMADFNHQRPDGQWGTYAIMGDGAVRWIPANIKPSDLCALATRAGGEKLSAPLETIAPRVDRVANELKANPKAVDARPEAKADPKSPAKSDVPAQPREVAPAPRAK